MDPRNLLINDFTYELPDERIAKYPLARRDASKLLVYRNGYIDEDIYYNLDNHIQEGSLLIFNNTKVIEARLLFRKSTGSLIELFCLEPADDYADITTAMTQKFRVLWKCLVGGAKKWKSEALVKTVIVNDKRITLTAKKMAKGTDDYLVEFSWDADVNFAELLHAAGSVPLPPYLNRNPEEKDKERYQTVYAKYDGSVAAPTAGLHFTEQLFDKLDKKNIATDFITLHVGAGTFKPVKTPSMADHEMHAEFIEVRKETIENILVHCSENIVAVGTTSLRTIETLYWLGIKTITDPTIPAAAMRLSQWEVYDNKAISISADRALQSLMSWMSRNGITVLFAQTQLIIAPGYDLKIATGLITNFHQPMSTLLLLVAAVVGNDWKRIYEYALKNDFRFLSYGDGSLLYKNQAIKN